MKVSVGQAASGPDVDLNVAEAVRLVHLAGDQHSDLVVLPELFLSSYDPQVIAADPTRWGMGADDPRLTPLCEACRNRRVAAVVGAPVVDEGSLRNGVLVISQTGRVEVGYTKVHLWSGEASAFTAGSTLQTVEVGGVRVGLGICYDAGFPEFVRAYARADVDLVVFSSAFADGEEEHRYDIYHAARALENGVYVAVANGLGPAGGQTLVGRSQIFDPQGHLLVDAGGVPGVVTWDVSSEAAASLRLPYLSDLISPLPVATRGPVDAHV